MSHPQISDNLISLRKPEKKPQQRGPQERGCAHGKPALCNKKRKVSIRNGKNGLKMGMNPLKWHPKEIGLQFHRGNGSPEMTRQAFT